MKMIDRQELDLTFVQGPDKYQKRAVGIEKKCRKFTGGNVKHRASIVMPNKKSTPCTIHTYRTKTQYA